MRAHALTRPHARLLALALLGASLSPPYAHPEPPSGAPSTKTLPTQLEGCEFDCITEAYPYAVLSHGTYADEDLTAWNGWRRQSVDSDFWSGYRASVYRSDRRREMVIAYSGTDLISIGDWFTDAQQWWGALPAQFEYAGVTAFNTLESMESTAELADYTLTFTGHSLGGALAQFVARSFRGSAFAFNTSPIHSDIETSAREINAFLLRETPGLAGSEERIINIVTRDEGGAYDFAADLLPGTLWGSTRILDVEILDDGPFFLTPIDRHAITTIIERMEQQLLDTPLGTLAVESDRHCDGHPGTTHWSVIADGTLRGTPSGVAHWWIDGAQVTFMTADTTLFSGDYSADTGSLSGTLRTPDGLSGCWNATFVPSP